MKAPRFWQYDGIIPHVLSPLGAVTAQVTARRLARPGWVAPVPVICVGNATVGGAGKTTVALDIAARLAGLGRRPHLLIRGYGGRVRTTHRVQPDDTAASVGDEALLLARVAPTWVGADRAASAQAAAGAGADVLVMDDGLQNPTLLQDFSVLVIDGETGFGNGRLLPAGPLREPVGEAVARCGAAVLIGPDRAGAAKRLSVPILRASLVPGPEIAALAGTRVLAVAGIGRPEKFFSMLERAGVTVAHRAPRPDHHRFSGPELDSLIAQAKRESLTPVTTPKDAVRLPLPYRAAFHVVTAGLTWEDESRLLELLRGVVNSTSRGRTPG